MKQHVACLLAVALVCSVPAAAQTTTRTRPGAAGKTATFTQVAADAAAAREAGRLEDAVGLYRKALGLRPSWDEGHWYLGTVLYELQRHAEARAAFAQLLRTQPTHAGAMALTGLCAFAQGDHDAALRALLQARRLNIRQTPELADVVRYHAGILLTRFSEFEAGIQILAELPADGMESPRVIDAFGLNVLRMPMLPAEMPDEARGRVQLAGRAGIAVATRQASEAATLLERLVAEFPATPNVHYAWGVFLLTADPPRAIEVLRQEIDRSPSHVPARLQIVYELVKQGDAEAARPYAEQAVAIAPDQFGPHLAMGQVHLGLGRLDAAITSLEQAARLAPGSAQPFYVLSVAYARAGREADAARARETFTRLSADATRDR